MSIWERLAGRKLDVKFTGAPATRRIKSYTALSGYSYQYYFDGRRDLETSKEYRFQVSSHARLYKAVLVSLPKDLIDAWTVKHDRELSATETYGIAKMLLFRHLDEADPGADVMSMVALRRSDLEEISAELDLN